MAETKVVKKWVLARLERPSEFTDVWLRVSDCVEVKARYLNGNRWQFDGDLCSYEASLTSDDVYWSPRGCGYGTHWLGDNLAAVADLLGTAVRGPAVPISDLVRDPQDPDPDIRHAVPLTDRELRLLVWALHRAKETL